MKTSDILKFLSRKFGGRYQMGPVCDCKDWIRQAENLEDSAATLSCSVDQYVAKWSPHRHIVKVPMAHSSVVV